jgi:hypothetical protein
LTALLLVTLLAQTALPTEKNWKQVCELASVRPYIRPIAVTVDSTLKGCNAEQAYYGYGKAPDPAAALRCALYQREHPKEGAGGVFSGPGILSMLYANGMGVPRDENQAIRFACELKWAAPAEMESRIGHLEKLSATGPATKNFDLCDDATSGVMMGVCEAVQQSFADAKRKQDLDGIMAAWPESVKQAFPALQMAEDRFMEARVSYEVDHSGTARTAFELEEQGRLRDQFLINLRRFGSGDIPQAAPLDQKLDDIYRNAIGLPAAGTIASDGIQKTEAAWTGLRDQWLEFARVAYPGLAPERVQAQVNRLRIHQLESLTAHR